MAVLEGSLTRPSVSCRREPTRYTQSFSQLASGRRRKGATADIRERLNQLSYNNETCRDQIRFFDDDEELINIKPGRPSNRLNYLCFRWTSQISLWLAILAKRSNFYHWFECLLLEPGHFLDTNPNTVPFSITSNCAIFTFHLLIRMNIIASYSTLSIGHILCPSGFCLPIAFGLVTSSQPALLLDHIFANSISISMNHWTANLQLKRL